MSNQRIDPTAHPTTELPPQRKENIFQAATRVLSTQSRGLPSPGEPFTEIRASLESLVERVQFAFMPKIEPITEVGCFEEAKGVFLDILRHAHTLEQLRVTSHQLKLCHIIHVEIDTLVAYTEKKLEEHDTRLDGERKALATAHEEQARVEKNLRQAQERERKIQSELLRLRADELKRERQEERLTVEIAKLEDQMWDESEKRENGLLDLIPGRGIVAAIRGEDPRRAIPFYSQVSALHSLRKNYLEKAVESRQDKWRKRTELTTQKYALAHQKRDADATIVTLKRAQNQAQNRIDDVDARIQKLGSEVQKIMELTLALKLLLQNYDFLQFDLSMAEELLREKITVDTLSDFINNVDEAHTSFVALQKLLTN